MGVLDPRDGGGAHRDTLLAWLAIQRAFALQPQKLPTPLKTEAQPARRLRDHAIAPLTPAESERVLRVLARHRARLVPITSPLYPKRIARLRDAPPLLAVRGNPALLLARCVGMVGARAATSYGREVAALLARDLSRAGLVIVSGLARGIDAAAHRGALEAGGATIAFQACGPESVYPAAHRGLAEEVIAQGALITEFPVGTPPRAPYFPLRNRLISALSEAVVVVEARIRSGSLTTARHAANQGVDVWAVPGPVGRPTSEGPLQLIRDGAGVMTRARDLLDAFRLVPDAARDGETMGRQPKDPLERRVWRALREEPRNPEELARLLTLSAGQLGATLAALEVDGTIERDRDGRFNLVSRRFVSSGGSEPL